MLAYLAIIGIVVGTAFWVNSPLLRTRKPDSRGASVSGETRTDLEIQKEEVYAAIKEMEFDHKMGKLSEEDFRLLREKYEERAIEYLRRIDEWGKEEDSWQNLGEEIEGEILALREGSGIGAKEGGNFFCSQCGRKISPADRFCSRCGNHLIKG